VPAVAGAHTRDTLADWGIDDVEDLIKRGVVVQCKV
jgi:hypothetical protein